MTYTDNIFFEEYKRLDRLCRDLFSCENGVSEYILQMEENVYKGRIIPSWDYEYKTLKHLRYVRNKIAHDETGCEISTEDDLLQVRRFYNNILSQKDPFSLLRQAEIQRKPERPAIYEYPSDKDIKTDYVGDHTEDNTGNHTGILVPILLIIVFVVIILYFSGI